MNREMGHPAEGRTTGGDEGEESYFPLFKLAACHARDAQLFLAITTLEI